MAHYAFIDDNNVVVDVIVGKDETDTDDLPEGFTSWEQFYENVKGMRCLRTSYNTHRNTHVLGGTPFRGNYASIGGVYNDIDDVFIENKPFESWVLNTTDYGWDAPVPYPEDAEPLEYIWDEDTLSWVQYN